MDTIITFLIDLLAPLGPLGLFLVIVITYIVDSFAIPVLPDVVYNMVFMTDPTLEWGFILPWAVVIGEDLGMIILYVIADRITLPAKVQKAMQAWGDFLLVHDERMLLIQRVAPMMMFVGVFVRVLENWRLSKALFYNTIACLIKYYLLSLLYYFLAENMDMQDAQNISVIITISLMVLCAVLSVWKKMRDGWEVKKFIQELKEKREAKRRQENDKQ
jgi:membrane protein DedA with SNARE-associated domain